MKRELKGSLPPDITTAVEDSCSPNPYEEGTERNCQVKNDKK